MVNDRLKRFLCTALAAAMALSCAFLLFVPLPRRVGSAREEIYVCVWEDGSVSEESFYSAYPLLTGIGGDGSLIIGEERTAKIATGEQFAFARSVLESGGLAELLSLKVALPRLERVALWHAYGSRIWYSGECFAFTGERVTRADLFPAAEFVLLSDKVSAGTLAKTGAATLYLRSEAEFTAETLLGTAVEEVFAEPPYSSADGAVYLSSAGGVRLLAGVPSARTLKVSGNDYADEGALLPCTRLEEISLPFVGNAPVGIGSDFRGEFAYLFSDGSDYFVPDSLKRIEVTGGVLVSHAFYRCGSVEEICACGVSPASVDRAAFVDCTSLRVLHTPNADVELPAGTFTSHIASCGCTVYVRTD